MITSLRSACRVSNCFLLVAVVAFSQNLPTEDDRLLALAKLWVTGAYFNPLVGDGQVDWDAQVLKAVPAVRSATTTNQYKAAIGMLVAAFPKQRAAGPQRIWMHYDLEHSAFVVNDVPAVPFTLDMGGGVSVELALSESSPLDKTSAPDSGARADGGNAYPAEEQRILAAYKLWGAMHYFFAYRDLMDADWDDEFPKFLQAFLEAKDAREYNLAVAKAVAKLDDSNTEAMSRNLSEYFGVARAPLRLRIIDKKPVITEVLDAASNAGVKVGDIVLRVDGEEVVARIDREAAYLPGSSHQALVERVAQTLLNGLPDSEAVLTLRRHDGAEAEVRVKRGHADWPDKSAAVKQLSTKVAYIDLTRLDGGAVDQAFASVAGKSGLILDARGPLRADPRVIAAKLNSKSDVPGAIVTGPLLLTPDLPTAKSLTTSHNFFSVESVPSGPDAFAGQIVMLIDGRTINEAERLGLYLEASRRVAFVGTDSAGACSTFSYLLLPGEITVQFSATDVRHGNSGKLQRIGLTPAVMASPELADIRAARDIVLEKAMEYLGEHVAIADVSRPSGATACCGF